MFTTLPFPTASLVIFKSRNKAPFYSGCCNAKTLFWTSVIPRIGMGMGVRVSGQGYNLELRLNCDKPQGGQISRMQMPYFHDDRPKQNGRERKALSSSPHVHPSSPFPSHHRSSFAPPSDGYVPLQTIIWNNCHLPDILGLWVWVRS